MKGVSLSYNDSFRLFSLSLKCCLTVSIYDNRPLSAYRNNSTVTRRAESWSLLQPVTFFFSHPPPKSSDCLQEGEESRSAVHWLTLGGVGCRAGGRERGRTVKCYRNSWLKRGNGRYRTSSIDTDLSGGKTQLQQKKPAGLRTRCSHNCASIASMRRSNGQMWGELCTFWRMKMSYECMAASSSSSTKLEPAWFYSNKFMT